MKLVKRKLDINYEARLFTMIELLIVLSIIIILIAMLIPVLSHVKDKVNEISCANNLAQQGLAFQSYAVDNNSYYPFSPDPGPNDGDGALGARGSRWENNLAPYLGIPTNGTYWRSVGSSIFLCPSSPVELKLDSSSGAWKYYHDGVNNNYNNTYEGMYGVYKALTKPEKGRAMVRTSYPEMPVGLPVQFCSRRQSTAWKLPSSYNGSLTNDVMGAASWHVKDNAGPRPTVFADGHANTLREEDYLVHFNYQMIQGPYSGWQMETGNGSPAHKIYDFWLDEY